MLAPLQIVVVPVMPAVGAALTVTACAVDAVHPEADVTVTVYVLLIMGETVMALVVAPVFQL